MISKFAGCLEQPQKSERKPRMKATLDPVSSATRSKYQLYTLTSTRRSRKLGPCQPEEFLLPFFLSDD